MITLRIAAACMLLFGMFAAAQTSPARAESPEPAELVTNSAIAVKRVARTPDIAPNVESLLERAVGVMIFPNVLKGAFFIGGEGGSGVLLVKQPDGSWSYPAFYTMGSVSFGLQFGGQSSAVLLIIMTERGLESILRQQVKLGGDVSAAVGPIGAGAEAATTAAMGADIVSYRSNQGLFVGASVKGAVIGRREDWNHSFYGAAATPREIVLGNAVSNPDADELRDTLARLFELAPPRERRRASPDADRSRTVEPLPE